MNQTQLIGNEISGGSKRRIIAGEVFTAIAIFAVCGLIFWALSITG
jgi:hypothetical protein